MAFDADRRLLLVHAHPDDETITTGATMARYAAEGAGVTLVTCTRGELGEVIPPELAHLAAEHDDTLGEYRVGELARAMTALGVHDHRFLDEVLAGDPAGPFPPVHYRDSGMVWGPDGHAAPVPDPTPGAFALADVEDAAARLSAVIREVRPQVLVTYEPGGGYNHPDHVQAHLVAMRAVTLAADPGPGGEPWRIAKVYWVVIPEGAARTMLAALSEAGENPFSGWHADRPLPSMFVPDHLVSTLIDGTAYRELKADALRAHATQVAVDGAFFALSNGIGQPLMAMEAYQLARGAPGDPRDAEGRETDLFAGLTALPG
jgi:N-acetyl-1-D-myo-inositol-2-amino-2-deoxy-alpha-D-glucopyranoside deacetylase